MKTIKEYTAKMGKMPTLQYRFICPICGLNSNIKKLEQGIFTPEIRMRAYLGRGGIQFLTPNEFPAVLNEQVKQFLIFKCKAILRYYNESSYPTSFIHESYIPESTSESFKIRVGESW